MTSQVSPDFFDDPLDVSLDVSLNCGSMAVDDDHPNIPTKIETKVETQPDSHDIHDSHDSHADSKPLPDFLEVCDMKAAPTSTKVKKEITKTLGKEQAEILFSMFEEKFIRENSRTRRVLTYDGNGICTKNIPRLS